MESDDLLLKTKRSSWRQRHYGGGRGGGGGGEKCQSDLQYHSMKFPMNAYNIPRIL